MERPDLRALFLAINEEGFDGSLVLPVLRWNSRLRSSAGRFIPGRRRWLSRERSVIEIADYLLEEKDFEKHVRDTLAHEMIHYWLWSEKRPYGHTREFSEKMKELGTVRYNPVPRRPPLKYVYECPECEKEYPARKKLSGLACKTCCEIHAEGAFDSRFELRFRGLVDLNVSG